MWGTRRPPPLVSAVLVAGLVTLSMAPSISAALSGLKQARRSLDATAQLVRTPPIPPVDVERMIDADTQGRASDRLATRLRGMAAQNGVLVEVAAPTMSDGAARVRLRVSGSQDDLAAFADAVERSSIVMRFATWTLAGNSAAVRLSGEVVAPWR